MRLLPLTIARTFDLGMLNYEIRRFWLETIQKKPDHGSLRCR